MGSINARAGDVLHCKKCGYQRELSAAVLKEIIERYFPGRQDATLYVSELRRFKCGTCGAKEFKLIERHHTTTPMVNTPTDNRWTPCHQCGGDGGAGGRCPRCSGNGFEPS